MPLEIAQIQVGLPIAVEISHFDVEPVAAAAGRKNGFRWRTECTLPIIETGSVTGAEAVGGEQVGVAVAVQIQEFGVEGMRGFHR